jgi:hypothetical protein
MIGAISVPPRLALSIPSWIVLIWKSHSLQYVKKNLRIRTVGQREAIICDDESCKGNLQDLINFEEKLPEHELERTYMEAKKSDLAIVLGFP